MPASYSVYYLEYKAKCSNLGIFFYQCEVDVADGLERTGHKYSLHLNRGLLVLRYILMDSEVCVYVDIH